jgi:hypothetical protein
MKKTGVLGLLALVIASLGVRAVLAQPQSIGPIPTSVQEVQDAFSGFGTAAWIMTAILFFIVYYIATYKLIARKRKNVTTGQMIAGIIVALIAVLILAPPLAGMLGLKGTVATGPSAACSISGPVELRLVDANTGAAVTTGKVYLFSSSPDLYKVIDDDLYGRITATPVRQPDSNGYVVFDNLRAGSYQIVYLPASYAVGSYEPFAKVITVYCSYKPNSDKLVTDVSAVELKLMRDVNFVNEVGTAVSGYTYKPASYPNQLQGFTVWLKPAATTGEVPPFYIYVNYDPAVFAASFKVNGMTIAPTKVADLDGSDPVRLNAPAGYAYVLKYEVKGLAGDNKIPLELSGTIQGNTTLSVKVIYLAGSERGDFAGPAFTFTVNNKAATQGWS